MTIEAGRKPEHLRVHLIPNSPFQTQLVVEDGTKFDAVPSFHFPVGDDAAVVWTASLSADQQVATWQVPSDEVDALIAASPVRKARLVLGPVVWAEGKFEVARD